MIRKSIRNQKIFPSDQLALKIVYSAIKKAAARWTRLIRDWIPAMNRFVIEYNDRFNIKENKVTQNSQRSQQRFFCFLCFLFLQVLGLRHLKRLNPPHRQKFNTHAHQGW